MTARNRKQARCPRHSRLPCDEWMPTGIERVPVRIAVGEVELDGDLSTPADALGVVLFAHGSGSSRFSPRNRHVAEVLNRARFATLLVDLLTSQEEAIDMRTARLRFDIGRLAERLIGSTDWLSGYPGTRGLSIGYFGASTGAGAALVAAPERTRSVAAIVSRGGRPDLERRSRSFVAKSSSSLFPEPRTFSKSPAHSTKRLGWHANGLDAISPREHLRAEGITRRSNGTPAPQETPFSTARCALIFIAQRRNTA